MEKIASSPQNVNKPNRKSNYAITTAKKSINTNIKQRVMTGGNKVDFHEINYFGGAILARGDSDRNDHTMNGKDAKVSQPNQELRLHVEHNDLIITKDPIADSAPKQIETIVGPRKFPIIEAEPIRNQSLISNIADRRKLMEKYTIKYKNPVESSILNANNMAKNPALANVTVVKTPIDSLKDDFRNKNSVQTNVVVVNDGQTKNLAEVARTKSKCSNKKINPLDGNVKTMIEKIIVEDSELDNSYHSVDTENAELGINIKHSIKQFTAPIIESKLNPRTMSNTSKFKNSPRKLNRSVGKSTKEGKTKSEKNEKLLITLRPTFPNNFTTSSESEIMASDDLEDRSRRSTTPKRISDSADAKMKNYNEPKQSTPKNAKDVKQIHQNLLKKNALLLTQLQKARLIDDLADTDKPEKAKKKKQKRSKKTVRPVSPPMASGAMSPTTTEVARWIPRSIDDHTKPYYEAWVNTTLAAINKNNPEGEKNELYVKKKNIIQSFQRALEDYGRNDIVSYDDYNDEKFTGRIKFKVKR